ncbi:granzyme A-like [Diretmus argenteus]
MKSYCAEVIGGKAVEPHSLPHMALLVNSKGHNVCGGTLIDPGWVLTAAHCADIKEVLLGLHSIKNMEKKSTQKRKVKGFPHPCFDRDEVINDLMLLKLDKKVKQTETVKYLPVPSTLKYPSAGTSCQVAGWGRTGNTSKMSDVLMGANVTVIDRGICNSPEYYNLSPFITQSMVCAGSVDKNRADTCQGDSGGPLLCKGVLVGVTSYGEKCGLKNKPGVYAFLSNKHINWITKTIQKSDS